MTTPRAPAPDARLRPLERMQRPGEFQKVLKGGKCFRDPLLRIHYRPNGRELSRLGLVVSRKMGGAVVRNRLKRCFREIFRAIKPRLEPPIDLAVVPDNRTGPRARGEYREVFERFVKRLEEGSRPAEAGRPPKPLRADEGSRLERAREARR